MSLITSFKRLSARKEIAATDVEGNFAEIVKKLGGTYYASGASTLQSAGTLGGSNFRPDAGITNDQKKEPYSYFALNLSFNQIDYDGAGTDSTDVYFTSAIAPVRLTGVEYSFAYNVSSSGTPSGSCVIYKNDSSATPVTSAVASVAFAGLAARTPTTTTSVSSLYLDPGDQLRVRVNITSWSVGAAQYVRDGNVCIWFKALHVG